MAALTLVASSNAFGMPCTRRYATIQTRDKIRTAFGAHSVDSARQLVAMMTGGVEGASS